MMDAQTRATVRERARNQCEYCRRPQLDLAPAEFHIEHIYPTKHGGSDDQANLCLSCAQCNWAKGVNLSGLLDGKIVPLFHPRRQTWSRHFYWDGLILVGKTLCGKVTVQVLNINDPDRVQIRQYLMGEGHFPPED